MDNLTRRERQIAAHYANGASYREIADTLFISPATVRTHIRTIYRKLGVCSKVALFKDLSRRTADASLRPAGRAEDRSATPGDRGRTGSGAGIGTAGAGLAKRAGKLRHDALLALASGLLQHREDDRLRASEVRLEAIVEALPAVVLLKDQALRYVFANRFFLDQWGLRPEDVTGRTQREVFSGELGFAWSRATDDRDARVLETGQETGFYVVRVPSGADGERALWARKLPLRDQQGSASQVLTVGIDITSLEEVPEEMKAGVPSPETPLPAAVSAHLPGDRAARILIVDAGAGMRRLAVEALERTGHSVETAASGREAMAVIARQPVDLIVADIMLPDLDGRDFQRALASRRPELLDRLIFTREPRLSADIEDFAAVAGGEVLERPFAAEDVVARVEQRLRVAAARR